MSTPTAPKRSDGLNRDVQWADGIRGLACLSVVLTHGFNGFYVAHNAFDRPYYFLTLPIIRLLLQGGYLAVTIFFVMSGYVCSLKPLKLARQGNTEAARAVIASSAFRRIIRLGVPAIFATTISWFLDQFGAFNTARSLPWNCWFHFFSPPEPPSFWAGLRELFRSFFRTWNYDGVTWYTQRNWYEGVQWTLAYELRGSFVVYLALVVTVGFTPFARVMSFFAIIAYSIYCDVDTLLNLPFFSGVLLADLSLVLAGTDSSSSSSYKGFSGRLRRCLNWRVALGMVGLFIGSYPPDAPELSVWSRFITRVGEPFLRPDWELVWAYTLIGTVIFVFAILFSGEFRYVLSQPIAVFLGSISFPMYLIHSFLMRSFLVWVVYAVIPDSGGLVRRPIDFSGEPVEKSLMWTLVTALAMISWLGLLVYLSVLWRDRLDGQFMAMARWGEEAMLGKKSLLGLFRRTAKKTDETEKVTLNAEAQV